MSLKESKDAIEQLYGVVVLEHFPNYEKFWVNFIGNPSAERIEPYRYEFPSDFNSIEKSKILEGYERVQMVHYALLCHLAGAHFQLKELEDTYKIEDLRERYFRHWEHYETGYLHLGSAFYMLRALWRIVLKLRGFPDKFRDLEKYLESKKKDELIQRLEKVENIVKIRRDQAVHYGRMASLPYKGKFYVPFKVHRDMKWSDMKETGELVETVANLREDTIETEKLTNDLHEVLLSEYERLIVEKNIKIICE